ncbi:hypothetical protein A0H81_12039 [Grifola frondosa]|uniref:Uncharacterized protein n=1 Tax=Grifola frondosa TaxID=5627 RepID=A0A1C7LTQ5_GRIFR|nr:hypothetical protein A0H81_12039 [Grifola frondosa]
MARLRTPLRRANGEVGKRFALHERRGRPHGLAQRGLYAIKSKATGKVLFSRSAQDPRVGHVDGDGVPRQGSLGQQLPGPPSATNAVQHFSFRLEEMQINKIEYDLKLGQIISSTPEILVNHTRS